MCTEDVFIKLRGETKNVWGKNLEEFESCHVEEGFLIKYSCLQDCLWFMY